MGQLLNNQLPSGGKRPMGRTSDLPARYGGEEFAVVLPDTSLEGALVLAEQLRQRVATLASQPRVAPLHLSVSCSIGVACFSQQASTPAELIEAADRALYAAKAAGKNRVKSYNVDAMGASPSCSSDHP
jgi:diguanylate cyclase (GGDEF)-like protein